MFYSIDKKHWKTRHCFKRHKVREDIIGLMD